MLKKFRLLKLGVYFLIAINLIALTAFIKKNISSTPGSSVAFFLVSPFQEIGTSFLKFVRTIWYNYFDIVTAAQENEVLKQRLRLADERENQFRELELANARLNHLLNFTNRVNYLSIAAEVIGKDPSPWFKTIIINKGETDGVKKGMPAVVPEGIAGIVIEVYAYYSKILLLIDSNFGADALCQRSRVRGIVKGASVDRCFFQYVLRRHDIQIGDIIVSSGLDGVFPKGLAIGKVSEISSQTQDIFQEVILTPAVDFETIEEVIVIYTIKSEFGLQ